MKGRFVDIGVDGDRGDPHLAAGPDHPHGNLTPIRNQELPKHEPLPISILVEIVGVEPVAGDAGIHGGLCDRLGNLDVDPGVNG